MSQYLPPNNERVEELLSALVTEGLDAEQQTEFDAINWQEMGTTAEVEITRFEQAAAAFAIAFDDASESLPDHLAERLTGDATEFFAHANKNTVQSARQIAAARTHVLAPPIWREALALLFAAASIAFLIFGLTTSDTNPKPLLPSEQMASLVRVNPDDLVSVSWTQVHDKTTTGKVIWSDRKQEGYMTFKGLPVNDPTQQQYQLWVFDTDAEQAHPVDGGVFDINNDGEVVVPIDVRIPVNKAVMFAVTIEKPGGVVVSKREQIPVLAKVE